MNCVIEEFESKEKMFFFTDIYNFSQCYLAVQPLPQQRRSASIGNTVVNKTKNACGYSDLGKFRNL